ncbi:MAG: hypothetical protein RIS31_295 [Actinomycetota bacterium]|jgi:hypothetical protein
MKKLFWLVTGVAVGLVAAKEIEKNPKAKAAYDDATDRLRTLVQAFAEGYDEEAKASKPAAKRASTAKTAK